MSVLKVALVGNPNVGKSTLFNALTGLKQRVGNYPGTTVEKRVGSFKYKGEKIQLYDFPGTYTLYPKSADEEVVFNILNNPNSPDFPDKVVVVGSPLQLKRSLLLYDQVRDAGLPVIFVLNMADEIEKNQLSINREEFRMLLGEDLIEINARNAQNISILKDRILEDFPIYESSFHVSPLFEDAVREMREKFNLKRDYTAYQFLAQPNISFFTPAQKMEKQAILKEFKIVSSRMQVAETVQRYEQIDPLCDRLLPPADEHAETFTEKLDKIITHPIWGYVIFFLILFLVFQAIYSKAEVPMEYIDEKFGELQNFAKINLGDSPLANLITDGIIPGISGIVIFVPQIFILTLFLLLLEESGYMSRVVFLMDKWMRPFGLNGKSVVPLMSGAACAIPGILAARNIENTKERLITMLVTPFITCSARLPVYAVLIALVIPQKQFLGFNLQGVVLMGLYLLGVFGALLFALIFSRGIKTPYKSYLIMEMPDYRIPYWKNVLLGLWEKVSAFVFGAGKIILAVSVILWVLASYGVTDKFKNAEEHIAQESRTHQWSEEDFEHHLAAYKLENSLLGNIGKTIEPVFKPLGYDWKISIGVLTSFAAREVFISTMATIYSLGSDNDDENQIVARMRNEIRPSGGKVFNLATGVSLMLFYAFAMQCLSTLAVVRRETGTWKWPVVQLVCMTGLAYLVSMLTYQLLS
ncbi:ferrous iron transport protein B [Ornithobacterium rhinotracheale]|uniref:ferrous iron transport protein B n=1 Tax=Ornithobacterium rhinotracheale TaxID=28251 RepID=UPI003FA41F62